MDFSTQSFASQPMPLGGWQSPSEMAVVAWFYMRGFGHLGWDRVTADVPSRLLMANPYGGMPRLIIATNLTNGPDWIAAYNQGWIDGGADSPMSRGRWRAYMGTTPYPFDVSTGAGGSVALIKDASIGDKSIAITGGSGFAVGDVLMLGSDKLTVTAITADTPAPGFDTITIAAALPSPHKTGEVVTRATGTGSDTIPISWGNRLGAGKGFLDGFVELALLKRLFSTRRHTPSQRRKLPLG